jgi:hypothetical protein
MIQRGVRIGECQVNLGYPNFLDAMKFFELKRSQPVLTDTNIIVLETFDEYSQLNNSLLTSAYLK